MEKGQRHVAKGDSDVESEDTLEKSQPSQFEIETLVALFEQERYDELVALARIMTVKFPRHAVGWKALGVAFLQMGRSAEALAPMRQAVALSPNDAEGHGNLGDILNALGLPDEAEASCHRALEIDPDNTHALNNLANALQTLGRLDEAVASFQRALQIRPDDPEMHSNLAQVFCDQGRYSDALAHFRKALDISPNLINAHQGIHSLLTRLVPQWHVPMMNEQKRNEAYLSALTSAVTPDTDIFEIGTGSGLLAMMAARLGAKRVTTCEAVPIIAETARRIISENGYEDSIRVIAKRSDAIEIGDDLPYKADILVSEIFSSELIGEHVLPCMEDAKSRLLKPSGRVIPSAGSIMIALFGGDDIRRNVVADDSLGFSLQHFNAIVSKKSMIARSDLSIELLTDDIEAFRFEFERDSFFPGQTVRLNIPVTTSGSCYGIIQWIRLQLDDHAVFENHPAEKSRVSNWQQVIYVSPQPLEVECGQVAVVTASHDRNLPWFFLEGIIPAAAPQFRRDG